MEELHQLSEPAMIAKLFASPALYATLALFFDYPHDPLCPRLISRYTGTDIKSVLRELKKLQEIGVIRSRFAGKERHYRLNEDYPVHEELASIFDKTRKYRRYAVRTLDLNV
jgi:DNA-binding transcriptional ArsR family regulator